MRSAFFFDCGTARSARNWVRAVRREDLREVRERARAGIGEASPADKQQN
jgi:hypothetical protein